MMLSNALKKSLSSVYEPNAYKKLYQLLVSFFHHTSGSVTADDFEIKLNALLNEDGIVVDLQ